MTNYKLSYTGFIQPDLNRYAVQATAYNELQLVDAAAYVKATLLNVLKVMDGFTGEVRVRLVDSKELRVDLVLDFANHDVYISAEHLLNNEHDWTAVILRGQASRASIDMITVNPDWFSASVCRPLQIMLVMYHAEITEFLNARVAELVETERSISKLSQLVAQVRAEEANRLAVDQQDAGQPVADQVEQQTVDQPKVDKQTVSKPVANKPAKRSPRTTKK